MQKLTIETHGRSELVEITREVQHAVDTADVMHGAVTIFVPHTTAGITINENADPDVKHDMLRQLDEMVPWDQPFYRHAEGNSAAHVKASMMGSSVTVFVQRRQLQLGRWQGIYLAEFDGPRTREVWVRVEGRRGD